MISLLKSINIKSARKAHRCHDCLSLIPLGDPYTKDVLKDGSYGPYIWNTCQYCAAWIEHMPESWRDPAEDLGPGWLNEAIDAYAYDPKTQTYGVES